MFADSALAHYQAALAAEPANYEALWKAAREAVDVGEVARGERQTVLYAEAHGYAQRAVQANANDAEGHFHLARAIGRKALSLGKKDRVKFAGEVRAHALKALELDPNHPGAKHVMGVWNAEVMRLSGIQRWAAKNLLGGKVFGEASWGNAVRYLQEAAAAEPGRIIHHLDLAEIYRDADTDAKGVPADARARAVAEYETVLNATPSEPNDREYQARARRELERLRKTA
jgi:tetratricopeptide (TPR) repeat protein